MDRKVLDISVAECRARRPTSGHSNRGNRSLRRRHSLRRNARLAAGDLLTGGGEGGDGGTSSQANSRQEQARSNLLALFLLPPSASTGVSEA